MQIIGDIDRVLAAVRHRAEAQAAEAQRRAESEAESIRAEAQAGAKTAREELLSAARTRAKEIRRERGAEKSRDEQHRFLSVREELLRQTVGEAREKLNRLRENGDEYERALKALAVRAATLLRTDTVVLSSDPRGQELLTDERLESWSRDTGESVESVTELRFHRADEPADIDGGIIAATEDGRRMIDFSFETRLNLVIDEERERIVAALWPKTGGTG